MNRKKVLAILGGGVVVAAGAGAAWVGTRTPTKALAPWDAAGTDYSEPRRRALSYAILAPNPHNQQPWVVDLSTPDQVTLFADTNRLLPHTDPFSRQITIGLGCFLELMRMAAASDGWRVDITPFPEGVDDKALDARPVAVARFTKDSSVVREALFDHVMSRRSLKEPYDITRPVSTEILRSVGSSISNEGGIAFGSTNDNAEVQALRDLTREAFDIELLTPYTLKESVDLFRIGKAEVEANPDGIDFSGAFFETLKAAGLFNREVAMDPASTSFQQALDGMRENCNTGMAYLWTVTPSNTRIDQLAAGREWVRINLATTAAGIGLQPMSQALQEYPEMDAHYRRAHQMLAPNGGTVQMLCRLGYGPEVPRSPRWPLEAKIKQA